jgi:uncharacterized protein YceK
MTRPLGRHPVSTTLVVTFAVVFGLLGLSGCVSTATSTSAKSTGAPGGIAATPHTNAVAAPGGGTIDQTVAPVDEGQVTKAAISQPAALPSKVTVSIVSAVVKSVKATTPGEIAGPAIVATVRIENNTPSAIDLGSTVVMVTDSAGNLGQATTAAPSNPFTGSVAQGKSLTAVYVFSVPTSGTKSVQISVSYAGGAPVALFTGDVS